MVHVEYGDGSTYDGELKDDKFHGKGTYTYPEGSKYEGEWKNHARHGQGKITYLDGTISVSYTHLTLPTKA